MYDGEILNHEFHCQSEAYIFFSNFLSLTTRILPCWKLKKIFDNEFEEHKFDLLYILLENIQVCSNISLAMVKIMVNREKLHYILNIYECAIF